MEQYNSIQQILKKENGHDRKPIYPSTVIQAVFDAKTGASLEAILAQFNSIYVQYQGTPEATRNIIPVEMRRAGLMITYMNMDSETITERASSAVQKDNDHWGLDINWSRVDELSLSGDIAVSAQGTWIINGEDTKIPARGSKGDAGITPWLKTINNKLNYSYDNVNWTECSDNIAHWFRIYGNKLQISSDQVLWEDVSDYIASYFRFNATSSDSQAGTIGKIQISRDNKTWQDLSPEFRNYLRIQGYVSSTSALPKNQVVGTIYGVNEGTNTYSLHVWDGTKWVNNGTFTSIAAGVVQETGDSETEVMSQKATTEKLSELASKLGNPTELIGYLDSGYKNQGTKNWRLTSKLDLNIVDIDFPLELNVNPLVNTFVYYDVNGKVVGSYGLKESAVEVFQELPNMPDSTRYVVISYSEKNSISYKVKSSEADNKIAAHNELKNKTSFRLNLPFKSYVDTNGKYIEHEYFRSSGYLPIELIASMSGNYTEFLVAYSIAFFDKNKSFIGGSELADRVIKSAENLIIPNDAVYMVVSQGTSNINNYSMDVEFTHEVTPLNMYDNLFQYVDTLKTRTSFRLSLPLKQYVNTNGNIVSLKNFRNSGFIPIDIIAEIKGKYVTSAVAYSVAFFNKEKMFISGSELLDREVRDFSEISIPSDAVYIMISQGDTVIDNYDLYVTLKYNITPLEWFEELSKSLGRTEVSDVVVGKGFDEYNNAKYDAYKSNQYWSFNNNVVGKVSKVSVYVQSGNTNNLYLCEKGVDPYFIASLVNDSEKSAWISSDVLVELTEGKYICVQNAEGSNILVTNCTDSQLGSTLVFTGDAITSTSKNWGVPIKFELSEKETRTVVQENYNRISEIEKKIGEGTNVEPHDTLAFIPIFGQSIAVGADAKPSISITPLEGVFRYSKGSLTPYREWQSYETSCYGMAQKLKEMYGGRLPWILVTGAYGFGGRTIQQLINGASNDTPPYHYERLKIEAQGIKAYCEANNLKMVVPAWCWIQGESDIVVHTQDYKQQLLDIHNDWQSFCQELTGQTNDVKMICYQTASFGRSVNYDVFPYNLDIPKVVLGQYELCKEDSRFVMSAPLYFNEHGPANIHLFAQDQKTLGGYEGKSLYRALIDSSYKNIYVKSHSVDGNVITLDIHVPCPPLVVDDNFVNHVDNAGFSVVKSDNTDIVEKVNVVYDKIIITCSESPIGCKLRYGATSQFSLYMSNVDGDDYTQSEHATTISSPDRMVGPRGNIHDSDNCVIGVANQIRALYNLMPYIQIELSAK